MENMKNYLSGVTAKDIRENPSQVFQLIAQEITNRQFEIVTNGADNVSPPPVAKVDFDGKFPELKPIGQRNVSRNNLLNAAKTLNNRA